MARVSNSTRGCKRPATQRRVLCPCCGKSVTPQTRTNHINLKTGAPHIKSAAFTYRQQVRDVGRTQAAGLDNEAGGDGSADYGNEASLVGIPELEASEYSSIEAAVLLDLPHSSNTS